MQQEKFSGYQHLFGTIDESLLGESYRVWLVTERGGEYSAYEAFPAYEAEKLGEAGGCDNGWSIYIKEEQISGAKLYLAAESGGRLYLGLLAEGK